MGRKISSEKKKVSRRGLFAADMTLLAMLACSSSVLFGQVRSYAAEQKRNYITVSTGSAALAPETAAAIKTSVGSETGNGTGTASAESAAEAIASSPDLAGSAAGSNSSERARGNAGAGSSRSSADGSAAGSSRGTSGSFSVYDKDKVWSTDTDIEIFHARYDNNGDGVYTVVSDDSDKVLAPGTENSYSFTLSNTFNRSLDYALSIEAYFEAPDGLWIPVEYRVSSAQDGYLMGSETDWVGEQRLNSFKKTGVLAGNHIADYRLDWKWPYERTDGDGLAANDAYDTMLGNLAVDQDLSLHVVIRTSTCYDEDAVRTGGTVKTGDVSHIYLWAMIAAGSLIALILVLGYRRREREDGTRA